MSAERARKVAFIIKCMFVWGIIVGVYFQLHYETEYTLGKFISYSIVGLLISLISLFVVLLGFYLFRRLVTKK